MNRFKKVTVLWLVLMLCAAAPSVAAAASYQLSASAKSTFDKMAAGTDRTLAGLQSMYGDLLKLQEEERRWDERITVLHYQNEESLLAVRKQMKQIDADKLDKLDLQVKQAREKYEPLFALYKSLNQQIATARAVKSKQLTAVLLAQAERIKPVVQLAREDIRRKESALSAAKASVAKTVKSIGAVLSDIDPANVQIRAERSMISAHKKRFSSAWTGFNQAVRKRDGRETVNSLTTLVSLSRQIIGNKQRIYTLEQKIGGIVVQAKKLIP